MDRRVDLRFSRRRRLTVILSLERRRVFDWGWVRHGGPPFSSWSFAFGYGALTGIVRAAPGPS
jgi:hypothetical protein